MRRWLDGADAPLDWAGPDVTADEWFFITTLYGQRTRDQQRSLIRHDFPRFVHEAGRDVRNLTPELTRSWVLHQATGWKTLSVLVRDCVGGHCFPIDSRVRKELERHRLPSGTEAERLLVSLSLALGRNPRQVARMFYEAGGVGGDFSV